MLIGRAAVLVCHVAVRRMASSSGNVESENLLVSPVGRAYRVDGNAGVGVGDDGEGGRGRRR